MFEHSRFNLEHLWTLQFNSKNLVKSTFNLINLVKEKEKEKEKENYKNITIVLLLTLNQKKQFLKIPVQFFILGRNIIKMPK